jgi:two-component system response regulator GlrR
MSWMAARILIVEDQDDVRRMLVTALEIEGHRVAEASNAADGLKQLQASRFDLVLSDYAMPGGTGTWMLHEASRQGLMDRTVALIVTAHPDVGDLAEVEVISKPLDLDFFLDQVRRILAGRPQPRNGEQTPQASPKRSSKRSPRHRIELVLYVSSVSPASMQARRNLERILQEFDASQVKFSVFDLARDPSAGDADRISFTPTLVKRFPEPPMLVLGNLKEREIVVDLLRMSGVDARR